MYLKTSDKEFFRIVNYIRFKYGINLYGKREFVEKRLDQVTENKRYNCLDDFMDIVEQKENEESQLCLISALVTNHTFFMREELHFEILKNVILPKIYKRNNKKVGIRIWSGAVSSGQEVYSILIIILEFLKEESKDWNIDIVASDISNKMLKKAKIGEYLEKEIEELPKEWVRKYFTNKLNGRYQVNDSLQQYITFQNLNLVSEIDFNKKFHVIFLRNVLIYFDSGLIKQIVDKVADYLETGGYLFIGLTETIEIQCEKLLFIQPSVYRKI